MRKLLPVFPTISLILIVGCDSLFGNGMDGAFIQRFAANTFKLFEFNNVNVVFANRPGHKTHER